MIRCLGTQTFETHQKLFGDKILTRSPKKVLKSVQYEKMLRPWSIHTYFKIMLLKFSFFTNVVICKKKVQKYAIFLESKWKLQVHHPFNSTNFNRCPILKRRAITICLCREFGTLLFPSKISNLDLYSLASQW